MCAVGVLLAKSSFGSITAALVLILAKHTSSLKVIGYSHPTSKAIEVHFGLPHPSALLTKCIQTLELKQSHECVSLCLRWE